MTQGGKGPDDPKGLIHEAYRIDGITTGECRTIFLDWALSMTGDPRPAIERLLRDRPPHPMTDVLREGLSTPARTGRRGGWAGRRV
ncbi:hypothetical protein [Jannaschia rubra]|uniref:Uncharacterized protein n=1 Tax=Jannaschia rubra TaxID=282197 RepID=A0A0M6XTL5_9RHOB|nr:hypothetical protein [Jannaschia rubra]CTQ33967.1 hypothetical protein JAN5088_02756 [Jannaschia rubra]SFG26314.1 hypothetical protein SAMN04488517_103382 [Jannaschia rubra]